MRACASTLGDAIERAIPAWVERSVTDVLRSLGRDVDDDVRTRVAEAGRAAVADGLPRVRALLETDVDEQRTNPLEILRSLVRHPTEVLREVGVPPLARDEFARQAFPDDDYALSPAAFADVDPALHEPGIVWGAAKAHVVLARRRREGRR